MLGFSFSATQQPPQPQQFGATSSTQQKNIFGGAVQPQSQAMFGQSQSQPSLFGSAPQSQGGLFGAPQSQSSVFGAAPQSQSNIFGAAPQSQSSLFGGGAQPQSNIFGSSAASSQPSLFGASSAPPQPSIFGGGQTGFGQFGSGGSLFGGGGAQTGFGQATAAHLKLPDAVTELVEKLNPSHPESRFHTTLYKVEDPALVPRHTRPPGMSERDYADAQMNNPDPSRLVPVQARLFDDLLGRAEAQETRIRQNNAILLNIQRTVADIAADVEGDLQPRLAAYRRRHRELARRVLRIASKVELAACRSDASGALSAAEVDHKRRLDALSQALTAPGVFKYKLCDLVELSHSSALENKEAFVGDLRDPRAASAVKMLLSEQLSGIQHLNEVCARVKRDVEIIADGVAKSGS